MMNEHNLWIWLIVGMIPYTIQQRSLEGGGCLFAAHALFWSVAICSGQKRYIQWMLRIPLIQRFQDAILAATLRQRKDELSQE
jgi:hypothetical protein